MKNRQQRIDFLLGLAYYAALVLLAVIFVRFLLRPFLPLLVGLGTAWLLAPTVRRLQARTHLSRRRCAWVVVLFAYVLIVTVLGAAAVLVFHRAAAWASRLPAFFSDHLLPAWQLLWQRLTENFPQLAAQEWITAGLQEAAAAVSGTLMSAVGSLTSALPGAAMTIFFSALSAAFLTADFDRVCAFVRRCVPPRMREIVTDLRSFVREALGGYCKAYLLLSLLTFSVTATGFLLLGTENPFGTAAAVALVDLLPLLGSGAVLLPWAVFCFVSGTVQRGVWLIVLWALTAIIRSVAEPKLLGGQIGLHPAAALVSMYAGLQLGGFAGLLAAPFLLLFFLHLYRKDKLKFF